jgi:hypothetical protein
MVQFYCRDEQDHALQCVWDQRHHVDAARCRSADEKYADYEVFSFVAANTSTGAVTMTVGPRDGSLATLEGVQDKRRAQAGRATSWPARFIWRSMLMRWTPGPGAL